MRKHLFSLVIVVAIVAVACAFVAQPAKAQARGQQQQQQPKPALVNIKVFTNMTYDQVRAEMDKIRDQLGARCRYCHVNKGAETDYVPETKMKETARQMIRMVQVLNEQEPFKSGSIRVNCATCHRGSPHIPVFVPGGRETWVPAE